MLCPKPWAEDMLCCWLLSTGLIERRLHMVRSYKFSRSFFLYFLVLSFSLFFSTIYKKRTMGLLSLVWLLMNPILPPHGKGWLEEEKTHFVIVFWWKALSFRTWSACMHACVCVCVCKVLCHSSTAVMGWIEWPGGLFQRLPRAHPLLCFPLLSTSLFFSFSALPWTYCLFKLQTQWHTFLIAVCVIHSNSNHLCSLLWPVMHCSSNQTISFFLGVKSSLQSL